MFGQESQSSDGSSISTKNSLGSPTDPSSRGGGGTADGSISRAAGQMPSPPLYFEIQCNDSNEGEGDEKKNTITRSAQHLQTDVDTKLAVSDEVKGDCTKDSAPPPPPSYDVIFAGRNASAEAAKDTLRVSSSGTKSGQKLEPFNVAQYQQQQQTQQQEQQSLSPPQPPYKSVRHSNMLASDDMQIKLASAGCKPLPNRRDQDDNDDQPKPSQHQEHPVIVRHRRLRRMSANFFSHDTAGEGLSTASLSSNRSLGRSDSNLSGQSSVGSIMSSTDTYEVNVGDGEVLQTARGGYVSNVRRWDTAMYKLIEMELERTIPDVNVRKVVTLCFSAFCVVFQETNIPKDESPLKMTDQYVNERSSLVPFAYTRMPEVPAGAARMLWRALIGSLVSPSTLGSDDESIDSVTGLDLVEWNTDPQRPGDIQRDPSLNDATVEGFFQSMSRWAAGEDANTPGETSSDPRPRKVSVSSMVSGVSMGDYDHECIVGKGSHSTRNRTADALYKFIRDKLVATGLIEVVGKHDDGEKESYYYTENEDSDNEVDDEIQNNTPQHVEPDADVSAWARREQKQNSIKARRKRRTQYLRIQRDVQQQYGEYLSSRNIDDDGFAAPGATECLDDELDDGRKIATIVREHATMKEWNSLMADECLKKRYRQRRRQPEQKDKDHRSIGDKKRRKEREEEPPPHEPWLFKDTRKWPLDDVTRYAAHMLPAHLMRADRNRETAVLLCSANFFGCRVRAMGAQKAALVHRQDLEELEHRIYVAIENYDEVGGDEAEIDVEETVLACCDSMVKYLIKEYAPLKVGENGDQEQDRQDSEEKWRVDKTGGENGRALHGIAWFLGRKDYSDEALSCYKKALRLKRAAMGSRHDSVARTLHNMGNLHLDRNEFHDAIRCYEDALRIEREKKNSKPNIATTLNSLGMIHTMSSHYDQAIQCYDEALQLERELYGNNNLRCAESFQNLGIIHGIKGDYAKAVVCYAETLRIKRSQLGDTHSEVADCLFSMGIIHTKMGDYASAVECYQKSLCVRKEVLGEDHEEVARVLYCLGIVLKDLGEIESSIRCYEECLRIRLLRLGDDHEDVARTLSNLGQVYCQSGDYTRAIECFEGSLRVSKKRLGDDHERIGDTLNSMGEVYTKLRMLNQARDNFLGALQIRTKRLGKDHLGSATTLHNLGDVYYMMNKYDEAMRCYNEAFRIRCSKLGHDSVDVATTRNNMGVVHLKKGENDQAMVCFTEALRVREVMLGVTDEKTGDTLHNMGLVHKNLGQYEQAILRYTEALKLRRDKPNGDRCLKAADTLYNVGIVYAKSDNYALALQRYREALATYRNAGLPEDHPSLANSLQWIKWAEKRLSEHH